ncbi:MAG: hypothetical protein ACREEE_04815 [Dongiaceae bacterium]
MRSTTTLCLGLALLLGGCAAKDRTATIAAGSAATTAALAIPPPPFDWPSEAKKVGQVPTRHVSLLNFGWPEDQRIEVKRKVSTTLGGIPQPSNQEMSYVLTAISAAHGFRIASSDVKVIFTDKKLSERVKSAYNKTIEELGPSLIPAFFVNQQGEFLRVENPEQVRDDLASMASLFEDEQKSQVGNAQVTVNKSLKADIKVEDINSRVSGEWNTLVGLWSGLAMKDGTPFPISAPAPGDAAALTAVLPATGTAHFAGLVACQPGEVEKKCVALELNLATDPEALKQEINARTKATTTSASYSSKELFKIDGASREYIARIVTEPDGLRPHRAQLIERVSIRIKVLSQNPIEFVTQQVTQLAFRYLPI